MIRFSIAFLSFLLLFATSAFSNKIDDLQTDSQVNDFVTSMNPQFAKHKGGNFKIQSTDSISKNLECNGIFKNWNIKNWEKVDITNDGLTDLVFIAYWYDYISYAYIDNGKNNFKLIRFSKNSFENCELIKPIKIGTENYLRLFRKTMQLDTNEKVPFSHKEVLVYDTLVFKFKSFIELEIPTNELINSIEINTSHCYGSCPAFNLKLFKNGKSEFEGIGYTKSMGKSSRVLSKMIFKDLSSLINYVNLKKLNNNYQVPWTDDQTATLIVHYNDGSKKTIKDYGMQGTFGLSAIYSKMMAIGTKW